MKSMKVPEDSTRPTQPATTYLCFHWKNFPPLGAGEDAEKLRAEKVITDEQYHRLLIWERDCGLQEMAPHKCLSCPHRRKVVWKTQGPVLVDPHGVETPVVDIATGEASPRNRHMTNLFQRPGTRGSHQTAAWVGVSDDKAPEGDG